MDKAQTFWDKQAKRFAESEKHADPETVELIARTKEFIKADYNVLDFGCATGTKTLKLAGSAGHIHGIDFSEAMIAEALNNKNNELNATNVSFSQGTIFSSELENGSFDTILAFVIIHLLEEDEKAVSRIHELLKSGGLFISATTCFREKMSFNTRMQVIFILFMKRFSLFPLHLNRYTTAGLEQMIKNQDFRIIRNESLFYNGMTISFIVAEKI
jgi:2-polyprenyl-3-methyl-5-hydroxy-6-metoxy-1,4-benzoquinol methylase